VEGGWVGWVGWVVGRVGRVGRVGGWEGWVFENDRCTQAYLLNGSTYQVYLLLSHVVLVIWTHVFDSWYLWYCSLANFDFGRY
jgi:hypothetical protein